MHQQIRTVPQLSPPDLQAFLGVLAKEGINIEAAGGSDIEHGGEFAIAVAHEDQDRAFRVLEEAGYKPRFAGIHYCALSNEPGQLLACLAQAIAANDSTGFKVKDIAIGVPDAEGRIQVQVYSELPSVGS